MDTILAIENATVLRKDRTIIDNVSFTMKRGEHWALLGPNGCGKTTIVQLATGYIWPSTGKVTVLGGEYGHVDISEYRKKIGIVSSALFERMQYNDTFRDVVISGRYGSLGIWNEVSGEDRAKADEITGLLSCGHIADRPYRVLSFGERQAALIGRAVMADPKLLILDEPFEGLDIAARERMLQFIDTLITHSNSTTLLLITHRVEEIAAGITHTAIMEPGRMLAAGKKKDTLTDKALSTAMSIPVEISRRNGRFYTQVV